jgi:hypothetical protein
MDLYYPPAPGQNSELVVNCHASVLSAFPSQMRYSIKGSKGSFVKFGMDSQLGDLAKIAKGENVEQYGAEVESLWGQLAEAVPAGEEVPAGEGTLQIGEDGVRFVVSKWVYLSWPFSLLSATAKGAQLIIRVKSEPGAYPFLYENIHTALTMGDKSLLEVKPEQTVDVLRLIEAAFVSTKERRLVDVWPEVWSRFL